MGQSTRIFGKLEWRTVKALLVGIAIMGTAARGAGLIPGNLLVADSDNDLGNPKIIEIDPHTGVQTVWASGGFLGQPIAMAFDGNGNLLVADDGFGGVLSSIIRINIATGQQTKVASGGNLLSTTGLVVEQSGNYVTSNRALNISPPTPTIERINPTTGVQTLVSTGNPFNSSVLMSLPGKIAIDTNGNFLVPNNRYISNGTTGLLRINAVTGVQTLVSNGGLLLGNLDGVCLEQADNSKLLAVVATPTSASLVEVDTGTGSQRLVASGGVLQQLKDVTEDASGNTFVTRGQGSSFQAAIYQVNLQTGATTLISSGGNLISADAILSIPSATNVPEPGSIALQGILAGVLLLRGKVRLDVPSNAGVANEVRMTKL